MKSWCLGPEPGRQRRWGREAWMRMEQRDRTVRAHGGVGWQRGWVKLEEVERLPQPKGQQP